MIESATYNPINVAVANTAQPFVKWIGGKRSLLDEILPRLPTHFQNYYEPFVGGGALFFATYPKIDHAVLTDTNLELALAYRAVQKEPEELTKLLKYHAARHSKAYYYEMRDYSPTDPVRLAARFLYLNKTCFNGLYRVNKSGKFNAPMGDQKNPNIAQQENILACSGALQRTDIFYGDFSKIEPQHGDFVYFDPPYHPTSETSFTSYTKENFTEKDQVRLRDFILDLHKRGVFVMLSNSKTKFIKDLYSADYFHRHTVHAPRMVNCKPDARGNVEEFLITNY